MDEFAQSREDDDLFADELEPVPEPTITRNNAQAQQSREDSKLPPPTNGGLTGTTAGSMPPSGPAGHRGGRGGSARVDRRGEQNGQARGGLASSRYSGVEKTSKQDTTKPSTSGQIKEPDAEHASTPLPETTNQDINTGAGTALDSPADVTPAPPPLESQTPQPTRPTAVRGDRTLTGGPAHKKLTEAELTEKMEKMKILNAQKSERFRLSEEDSAAYARKEKEMAKKRVEEQKNARAMDMERAKNRQRKLAAQGGREWDSEKQENDIVDGKGRGRSSEFVRGGHGGVIRGGMDSSRYAQAEAESDDRNHAGRGRGGNDRGRGNRGGRGGARGGKSSPATVPTTEDFPDLPPAPTTTKLDTTAPSKARSPNLKSSRNWAEEMATPVEEKKIGV